MQGRLAARLKVVHVDLDMAFSMLDPRPAESGIRSVKDKARHLAVTLCHSTLLQACAQTCIVCVTIGLLYVHMPSGL